MKKTSNVIRRIESILELARTGIARTVNTTQVVANWLVGREIVEEEQSGRKNAGYGQELISTLAEQLQKSYGGGYGETNLKLFRQFYLLYPRLLDGRIGHTLRDEFSLPENVSEPSAPIRHTRCDESWTPGQQNIFTSRYQFHLPTEADLAAEIRRELALLAPPVPARKTRTRAKP